MVTSDEIRLCCFELERAILLEIGSDRFHLLSAVSADSASLSIANGAEIREIKIDHW